MRWLSVSVTKLFLYSSKMQILGEEGGKITKFTTKIDNWHIMNSNDFTVLKLQCDSIVLTLDNDNRNKIINSNFWHTQGATSQLFLAITFQSTSGWNSFEIPFGCKFIQSDLSFDNHLNVTWLFLKNNTTGLTHSNLQWFDFCCHD